MKKKKKKKSRKLKYKRRKFISVLVKPIRFFFFSTNRVRHVRLIAKFNEEAFNIPTKLSISQDCSSKPSDVVCHLNFFCFLSNYLFYNKYLLEKLFTLESIAQAFFSGKPVKMILLPTVGEYIYACLEFS